jgi:hypothetical protein
MKFRVGGQKPFQKAESYGIKSNWYILRYSKSSIILVDWLVEYFI